MSGPSLAKTGRGYIRAWLATRSSNLSEVKASGSGQFAEMKKGAPRVAQTKSWLKGRTKLNFKSPSSPSLLEPFLRFDRDMIGILRDIKMNVSGQEPNVLKTPTGNAKKIKASYLREPDLRAFRVVLDYKYNADAWWILRV